MHSAQKRLYPWLHLSSWHRSQSAPALSVVRLIGHACLQQRHRVGRPGNGTLKVQGEVADQDNAEDTDDHFAVGECYDVGSDALTGMERSGRSKIAALVALEES